jgi:hypothetical protein
MTQQPWPPQQGYGPPPQQQPYQPPYGQPPTQAPWGPPPQQQAPAGPQAAPAFTMENIFDAAGRDTGAPGFAFQGIGHSLVGKITHEFATAVIDLDTGKPKVDKTGQLRPQLNVTLQTGYRGWAGCKKAPTDAQGNPQSPQADTGLRRAFAKDRMLQNLGAAVQGVFGKTTGISLVGCWVKITHSGDIPTGRPQPLKDFTVKLWPATDQPPQEIQAELQAQSQAPPLPAGFAQQTPPGGHPGVQQTINQIDQQLYQQQQAPPPAAPQDPWGQQPQRPAAQNPWPPQQPAQQNPFGGQPDQPPF